jgi:tetratricopeptide (TPR) repeat protein
MTTAFAGPRVAVPRPPLAVVAPSRPCCASATPSRRRPPPLRLSRRAFLLPVLAVAAATAVPAPNLAGADAARTAAAPAAVKEPLSDDARDEVVAALREVTRLQDAAFDFTNAGDFASAERYWDRLIAMNDQNAAAYSNRGNCRTSQGLFREAVADFDRAIALAPAEPDCHLGKGVALEGLRDFRGALDEYAAANERSIARYGAPDAVAINNRGNALGALGEWQAAAESFDRAASMSRENVFARANEAYALYEVGRREEGVEIMESLLRRYPTFCDVRAALVAVYRREAKRDEAENYWLTVLSEDVWYKERDWVRDIRRWPPALQRELDNFRSLRA